MKPGRLRLLNGILLTSALAWPVASQTAPPIRRASARAVVKKVTLKAEAPSRALVCPATLRFRATVVTATSGLVRYRFRYDDGNTSPYFDMAMKEKEARDVVHLVRTGKAGNNAVRGTLRLEVTSLKGVQIAKAIFAVTCVSQKGTGEAEEDPLKTECSAEIPISSVPRSGSAKWVVREFERNATIRQTMAGNLTELIA